MIIFVEGMLGIHKYAICPHYNAAGRECFDEMLRETNLPGFALERDPAFVDNNGIISFVRSRSDAKAYRVSYDAGNIEKYSYILMLHYI